MCLSLPSGGNVISAMLTSCDENGNFDYPNYSDASCNNLTLSITVNSTCADLNIGVNLVASCAVLPPIEAPVEPPIEAPEQVPEDIPESIPSTRTPVTTMQPSTSSAPLATYSILIFTLVAMNQLM